MTTITRLLTRHPVTGFYALVFAISWGGILLEPEHDDVAGEAWFHGRFGYMLYRRPRESRYAAASPSR